MNEAVRQLAGMGRRFVCWKWERRGEKRTKPPVKACGYGYADATDPATWATYEEARAAMQAEARRLEGIGFVLGDGVCGVDLDGCRDPATGEVEPWARAIVEELRSYAEVSPSGTGIKVFCLCDPVPRLSKNRLVLRRTNDGAEKDRQVELYTSGRYFCITGEHLDGTPDELTDATEAFERLARRMTEGGEPMQGDGNGHGPSPGSVRGNLDTVREALAWVEGCDDYADWIAVGMEIKDGLGDAGFELWDEWSSRSRKYPGSAACRRKWGQLHPRGERTIRSLYWHALNNGWQPSDDAILDGDAADSNRPEVMEKIKRLVANVRERTRRRQEEETRRIEEEARRQAEENTRAGASAEPEDARGGAGATRVGGGEEKRLTGTTDGSLERLAMQAPGLLGAIVRHILGASIRRQPALALGAALTAVAVAAGRRYRLASPPTHPILYVVGINDSGGGKNAGFDFLFEVLTAARMEDWIKSESPSSGAAIYNAFEDHACALYPIDEIGHFIAAALNERNGDQHKLGVMNAFTKLWSSGGRYVKGIVYSNKRDRPPVDVHCPATWLYAATSPRVLWEGMRTGAIGDGSIPRIMFFGVEVEHPKPNPRPRPMRQGLEPIVRELRIIAGLEKRTGNLAAVTPLHDPKHPPSFMIEVPAMPDAEERISRLMDECDAPLREHANSMLSPIFARTGEHALRVALVAAIAKNPQRPALDLPTLEWAIEVVRACERFLVEQIERHVADTEHEGKVKKVLGVIRKAGGWIDGSALAKRTLFINAKERDAIVRQLEEAGEIERRTERPAGGGAGRPRIYLRTAK